MTNRSDVTQWPMRIAALCFLSMAVLLLVAAVRVRPQPASDTVTHPVNVCQREWSRAIARTPDNISAAIATFHHRTRNIRPPCSRTGG